MPSIITGLQEFIGAFLTPKEKRGLIRSLLPGALEEGLSGNQALTIFKEYGYGIRETDYWNIWRQVKGLEEQAQRVKFIRRDSNLNPQLFGSLLRSQDEKYAYVGSYSFFNPDLGVVESGIHWLQSDNIGTRGSIEEQIRRDKIQGSPRLAQYDIDVSLIRAYRNE